VAHVVFVEFRCRPGKAPALLEVLAVTVPETEAFDGCRGLDTYRADDNPDVVVLWGRWDRREDHAAYLAWRSTETDFFTDMDALLTEPPRIVHLTREG